MKFKGVIIMNRRKFLNAILNAIKKRLMRKGLSLLCIRKREKSLII